MILRSAAIASGPGYHKPVVQQHAAEHVEKRHFGRTEPPDEGALLDFRPTHVVSREGIDLVEWIHSDCTLYLGRLLAVLLRVPGQRRHLGCATRGPRGRLGIVVGHIPDKLGQEEARELQRTRPEEAGRGVEPTEEGGGGWSDGAPSDGRVELASVARFSKVQPAFRNPTR